MKLLRSEKLWLATVTLFFLLFNAPGVPTYHDAVGLLVHALMTIVPLWVAVYVGLVAMARAWPLRENNDLARDCVDPVDDATRPATSRGADANEEKEGDARDA